MELALKKTDYLVVDDRDTGSSPSGNVAEVEGGNISMSGNSFTEVLGHDPWAELATPLTKFEMLGTWYRLTSIYATESLANNRQIWV